jgi:hypothetical protein
LPGIDLTQDLGEHDFRRTSPYHLTGIAEKASAMERTFSPCRRVRMMTWGFAARLGWNAPVVLGSDGPQAQPHPSLAAKPQVLVPQSSEG